MVDLGGCMVDPGGHVWLLLGGLGHAWLLGGGVVSPGGCVVALGGHVWDTTRYADTVKERAVRILLECILVWLCCNTELVVSKI